MNRQNSLNFAGNSSIMKRGFWVILFVAIALLSGSWGFLVHRTIHQLSVYQLPEPMRPYFYKHMDYLVAQSVRPDQRRNEDPTEATKHFIDLEAFGDSAAWKMPREWEKAVKQFTRDSLIKYGYVPYHIMVMKDRLTNAFRSGKSDSILFFAADIGHYIGDAHVPLHTTINYDGQLTNQRGLHALWETVVPEIELNSFDLSTRHKARYMKDPVSACWQAVQSGWNLLDETFVQEREATKLFTDSTKYRIQIRSGREMKYYTSAFAKEYYKRVGVSVNKQLIRSSEMIADMWYTCWVDAGKPDLNKILTKPYTKADKKQFKEEQKACRHNELLQKNWLISKKNAGGGE